MKERMLVIEDDRNIREMLRRGLIFEDYEVDSAENGEDGLRFARTTPSTLPNSFCKTCL